MKNYEWRETVYRVVVKVHSEEKSDYHRNEYDTHVIKFKQKKAAQAYFDELMKTQVFVEEGNGYTPDKRHFVSGAYMESHTTTRIKTNAR